MLGSSMVGSYLGSRTHLSTSMATLPMSQAEMLRAAKARNQHNRSRQHFKDMLKAKAQRDAFVPVTSVQAYAQQHGLDVKGINTWSRPSSGAVLRSSYSQDRIVDWRQYYKKMDYPDPLTLSHLSASMYRDKPEVLDSYRPDPAVLQQTQMTLDAARARRQPRRPVSAYATMGVKRGAKPNAAPPVAATPPRVPTPLAGYEPLGDPSDSYFQSVAARNVGHGAPPRRGQQAAVGRPSSAASRPSSAATTTVTDMELSHFLGGGAAGGGQTFQYELSKDTRPVSDAEVEKVHDLLRHKFADRFKQIRRGFREMDQDGSGLVDRKEAMRLLMMFNLYGVEPRVLDRLLDCADINGDGKVQYDEFCKYILSEDALPLRRQRA